MSYKVSEYSQLGGSFKLQPHEGVPVTQIEVKNAYEDIMLPQVQSYDVGNVVTFQSNRTSQFTDLTKSYIRISGRWRKANNTACLFSDGVSPVCNFPAAMFPSVQLYMNDTAVSPNRTGDPYISFVNRLVLGRSGAFQNSIQSNINVGVTGGGGGNVTDVNLDDQDFDQGLGIDFLDYAGFAYNTSDLFGANASGAVLTARNTGANARASRVINDAQYRGDGLAAGLGTSQYIYQPELGAWKVEKVIPDLVSFRLLMTIGDSRFYTRSGGANNWEFTITKMELVLHRLELNETAIQQNAIAMIERPWVAPTYVMEYQPMTVAVGANATSLSLNLTGAYSGAKPKFVLVGIQDTRATGNDVAFNPYYMDEGNGGGNAKATWASELYILVNGKQYPEKRPYQPTSPVNKVREYRALCEVSKKLFNADTTPLINYQQFCLNYTWYAFLIDPVEGDLDTYSATEDVNIEVHGVLQAQTGSNLNQGNAGNITAHVICFVPAILQIDGSRTCLMKSKSGVPIQYM